MAPSTPKGAPAAFARAVATLRSTPLRPEIRLSEVPAPQRLAPHSLALSAEVTLGDDDLATGRLVLLHDPAGQDAWEGPTRLVAFIQAPLDPVIGADPLLPSVGWSWLTEALSAAGASYTAVGGTVTRVNSEKFGTLSGQPEQSEVELRASWSPVDEDLAAHLCAFGELLCAAAGLPPSAPGVVAIPASRPGRRLSARRPGAASRR